MYSPTQYIFNRINVAVLIVLLTISCAEVSFSAQQSRDETSSSIISDESLNNQAIRALYSFPARAWLESVYYVGRPSAKIWAYAAFEGPEMTAAVMSGTAGNKITKDLLFEAAQDYIESPEKVSEEMADAMMKRGIEGYRRNYARYKQWKKAGELSATERENFVTDNKETNYLSMGKELWTDVQLYKHKEGKYANAVDNANKGGKLLLGELSRLADMSESWDVATTIARLADVVAKAKSNLESYPPYNDHLERVVQLKQKSGIELPFARIDEANKQMGVDNSRKEISLKKETKKVVGKDVSGIAKYYGEYHVSKIQMRKRATGQLVGRVRTYDDVGSYRRIRIDEHGEVLRMKFPNEKESVHSERKWIRKEFGNSSATFLTKYDFWKIEDIGNCRFRIITGPAKNNGGEIDDILEATMYQGNDIGCKGSSGDDSLGDYDTEKQPNTISKFYDEAEKYVKSGGPFWSMYSNFDKIVWIKKIAPGSFFVNVEFKRGGGKRYYEVRSFEFPLPDEVVSKIGEVGGTYWDAKTIKKNSFKSVGVIYLTELRGDGRGGSFTRGGYLVEDSWTFSRKKISGYGHVAETVAKAIYAQFPYFEKFIGDEEIAFLKNPSKLSQRKHRKLMYTAMHQNATKSKTLHYPYDYDYVSEIERQEIEKQRQDARHLEEKKRQLEGKKRQLADKEKMHTYAMNDNSNSKVEFYLDRYRNTPCILTGADISYASVTGNSKGNPCVRVVLTAEGRRKLSEATSNISPEDIVKRTGKKSLYIYLDGKARHFPTYWIKPPIDTGELLLCSSSRKTYESNVVAAKKLTGRYDSAKAYAWKKEIDGTWVDSQDSTTIKAKDGEVSFIFKDNSRKNFVIWGKSKKGDFLMVSKGKDSATHLTIHPIDKNTINVNGSGKDVTYYGKFSRQ